jgi:hypothetical protein
MDEKENCGSIYTEEVFSRVRENKTWNYEHAVTLDNRKYSFDVFVVSDFS